MRFRHVTHMKKDREGAIWKAPRRGCCRNAFECWRWVTKFSTQSVKMMLWGMLLKQRNDLKTLKINDWNFKHNTKNRKHHELLCLIIFMRLFPCCLQGESTNWDIWTEPWPGASKTAFFNPVWLAISAAGGGEPLKVPSVVTGARAERLMFYTKQLNESCNQKGDWNARIFLEWKKRGPRRWG